LNIISSIFHFSITNKKAGGIQCKKLSRSRSVEIKMPKSFVLPIIPFKIVAESRDKSSLFNSLNICKYDYDSRTDSFTDR